MIYTHAARQGVTSVVSPLDLLQDVNAAEIDAALDATRRLGMSPAKLDLVS
jgi:hypothetical protein